MTITRSHADNLLTVLALAHRAIPADSPAVQCQVRARLLAAYATLAEAYAEAGYDVEELPKSAVLMRKDRR